MAIPTIRDLVLYVNKKLTGNDWNTNWRKLINWLTDGKADIKVKSLELSAEGGLINNGSIVQNGNFDVSGNIVANGNITISGSGVFTGDGSGLYNLEAAKMFPYVPWCINSGNVNVSGNGDLIRATAITSDNVITGYTIDFNVGTGTYGNIGATSASGEHFTITSLTAETISSANTEYFFFIKKGENFVTVLENIKIFRQKTEPTGDNVVNNYVWLDTSCETLTCRKYSSLAGEWGEWDYVPLGKVVTAALSSAPTITTFAFNQNEYSVNTYSQIFTDIRNARTPYPNYTTKRQVLNKQDNGSATWTVDTDGWVIALMVANSGNYDTVIKINDVSIYGSISYTGTGGSLGYADKHLVGPFPVKKGDVLYAHWATFWHFANR